MSLPLNPFDHEYLTMGLHLLLAAGAGAIIGMERSYHGRPAGFRTHTLVCMASALLMLLTLYQDLWFKPSQFESVTLDPTRMAQGIMTGIGFLGAGVIMKDGLSVRGLTTAASIWITAAIGILVGVGFYVPAGFAVVLTLSTLSVFRWVEQRMPMNYYAQFVVRFPLNAAMNENDMRALLTRLGFSVANLHTHMDREADYLEYNMIIRTLASDGWRKLSEHLAGLPAVRTFRISPTGD